MGRLTQTIYFIFIRAIPIGALVLIGFFYCYRFIVAPFSLEREQIFFGLDVAVATIAGLSFYASYTSGEQKKKGSYYSSGEQFFHATVLLVINTFLQGVLLVLKKFSPFLYFNWVMRVVLTASIIITFCFALVNLVRGLNILLVTLGSSLKK